MILGISVNHVEKWLRKRLGSLEIDFLDSTPDALALA